MSQAEPGRIPCPSCNTSMPLAIEAVLDGTPIECAGCGLLLTTDTEASGQALEALRQWYRETREARAQAESATPGGSTARTRRRRRTRR